MYSLADAPAGWSEICFAYLIPTTVFWVELFSVWVRGCVGVCAYNTTRRKRRISLIKGILKYKRGVGLKKDFRCTVVNSFEKKERKVF